jgi:cell division protein FtsZ
MYNEGIHNVSFVLCNTDRQALDHSPVPFKLQLGKKGLGAGGLPEKAKEAANESIDNLKRMLSDGTEMVFITAGMGGGTGTGAAPVIAQLAKDMGILTVGIVTIPFLFEEKPKILLALKGVEEIKKNVDALLVINNERLFDIYPKSTVKEAFKNADNILTVSARSIAEIITIWGERNLDFADVNTTLYQGGVAIISSGTGSGPNRLSLAIKNALESPLLNNNDIYKAKRVLLNFYSSEEHPLLMEELEEIKAFMAKFTSDIKNMKWGDAQDDSLGESVKITILASGFGLETITAIGEEETAEETEKERTRKEAEKEVEKIKKEAEERELLNTYYGANSFIKGKMTYPKPFIFTLDNMDYNPTIDTLLKHPAYNRTQSIPDRPRKTE